ncbi:hypothetical protein AB4090_05955 [Acidithiobacillus sp. IBUN Pt1247-S3]|uniref:hypothetical protein n=1 Tax=Acidithiobacillus sp. IBUN Pt1247-S3 TaxID=3166642 RepID=UPI0034E4047F
MKIVTLHCSDGYSVRESDRLQPEYDFYITPMTELGNLKEAEKVILWAMKRIEGVNTKSRPFNQLECFRNWSNRFPYAILKKDHGYPRMIINRENRNLLETMNDYGHYPPVDASLAGFSLQVPEIADWASDVVADYLYLDDCHPWMSIEDALDYYSRLEYLLEAVRARIQTLEAKGEVDGFRSATPQECNRLAFWALRIKRPR